MIEKFISKTPCGIASLIAIFIVLFLTLTPISISDTHIPIFKGTDKIVHFILFFILSIAFWLDFCKKEYPHHIKTEKMLFILVLCLIIGGFIEYLQEAMEMGRTGDFMDFIADAIGSIFGFFISWKFLNRYYRDILKIKNKTTRKPS